MSLPPDILGLVVSCGLQCGWAPRDAGSWACSHRAGRDGVRAHPELGHAYRCFPSHLLPFHRVLGVFRVPRPAAQLVAEGRLLTADLGSGGTFVTFDVAGVRHYVVGPGRDSLKRVPPPLLAVLKRTRRATSIAIPVSAGVGCVDARTGEFTVEESISFTSPGLPLRCLTMADPRDAIGKVSALLFKEDRPVCIELGDVAVRDF